jgi:hypothetical protein
MANIKEQKLLYHLTSLKNLPSILEKGLLARSELQKFDDVADPEILIGREKLGLEKMVPFHFFSRNPFDGNVQSKNPKTDFILISISRTFAAANEWNIIPRHPLAGREIEKLSYSDGIEAIDWEAMSNRDYSDAHSKSVCMAECLSPITILPNEFFSLFVANTVVKSTVEKLLFEKGIPMNVNVNPRMFLN